MFNPNESKPKVTGCKLKISSLVTHLICSAKNHTNFITNEIR